MKKFNDGCFLIQIKDNKNGLNISPDIWYKNYVGDYFLVHAKIYGEDKYERLKVVTSAEDNDRFIAKKDCVLIPEVKSPIKIQNIVESIPTKFIVLYE